jgi:hypothetical protein
MLIGQSKVLAEILSKALSQHDDSTFNEYSIRLGVIRSKIEELMWVLNENEKDVSSAFRSPHLFSTSLLDERIQNPTKEDNFITVGQLLEKLKSRELHMNQLSSGVCDLVRKAALQLKHSQQ